MLITVQLEHDYGVPKSWAHLLSSSNPETITVPVTYHDQRSDDCSLPAWQRQFEYTRCRIYGVLAQGLVQNRLGPDGKPAPTHATVAAAARERVENRGIWGDNFRRWFNEVEGKSKRIDGRTITFNRIGDNTYTFGGPDFFPLDDIDFSKGDYTTSAGHNFHFTAMASFPFEVQADGRERWEFLGDDDVWVFINGHLVLDIGGLHTAIDGWLVINEDGTVTTNVDGIPGRIDLGLKHGDVAQLSWFYAERSTSDANCKITIRNMVWPIRAEADIKAETVDNKLIRYTSSITNRDPINSLDVTHIASFVNNGSEFNEDGYGFIPLTDGNLFVTFTPEDENSWRPVYKSAPHSSGNGFQLESPIKLAPNGGGEDTAYFSFYVAPDRTEGKYYNTITYKTNLNGVESLARASDYAGFENIIVTPRADLAANRPADLGDGEDGYLDPLGEQNEIRVGDGWISHPGNLFAPDTGLAAAAEIVSSQWFLLGTLLVFGASFAVYYPNRRY
jgi:fibro-slime domain-containing protein